MLREGIELCECNALERLKTVLRSLPDERFVYCFVFVSVDVSGGRDGCPVDLGMPVFQICGEPGSSQVEISDKLLDCIDVLDDIAEPLGRALRRHRQPGAECYVRSELNSRQLTDLPVGGGRNYQSLFKLVPGFTPPCPQNSLVANPQEDLVMEVNGTTKSTNNTRSDGANNIHIWLPQHSAYVPPVEAIEQVNVVTNSMDAEQGLAGGAAISVTVKSGTNELHGVGFEYNTNSHFQARNVFYTNPTLPKNIQNQYGGTLGGPIVKNKLFFFVSDEETNRRTNVSRLVTIPTAAQEAGDFSSFGTTIYDPLTSSADGSGRMPFVNNVVPLARQSRVAQQLISWLPQPTNSALTSNYFATGTSSLDRNAFDGKVNWNKSDKWSVFGRFSILNFTTFSPTPFDKASGQSIDTSQQAGPGQGRIISSTIGTNYIVTPAFLLDGNIGYTRLAPGTHPIQYGQNIGLDVLKLPGTNGLTIFESGIPEFQISGSRRLAIRAAQRRISGTTKRISTTGMLHGRRAPTTYASGWMYRGRI
jgi:hypothetical protein